MRVKRGFVYAGIFLVALGGVLAAADAGRVDAGTLGGIVRLWPVAFVAVGAALILRRTKLGLSGGMVAAAMPGLLLGSGIAFVPKYSGTCAADQAPALAPAGHGSFFGPPMVSIYTGCGRTDIHTQPGTTWQLLAGNTGAAHVALDSDGRSLGITDNLSGSEILSGGRSAWDVTLPRMRFDQLDLNLND